MIKYVYWFELFSQVSDLAHGPLVKRVRSILFVCLGVFVPLKNFPPIWTCHNCWWRVANFYLCSALIAEQWGIFSLPHLLWHRTSVYVSENPRHSHLLLSVWCGTVTTCFTTFVCRRWDSNTQPSAMRDEHSNWLRHRAIA